MKYEKLVRQIEKRFSDYSDRSIDYFKEHVLPVRGYAVKLADFYGANRRVAELAALFHDSAYTLKKGFKGEHQDVGANIALGFLRGRIDEPELDLIIQCIQNHPGISNNDTILEERVVTSADAMSHIILLRSSLNGYKIRPSEREKVVNRFTRSEQRIVLPYGFELIRPEYDFLKELLNGKS